MNNKKEDKILVFLHLQKTAGTTFNNHLKHYLKKTQYIEDYSGRHVEWHSRNSFLKSLNKLSNRELNKLKIIYGHKMQKEMQTILGREVVFFTFLRNPVDWSLSMYNFLITDKIEEGEPSVFAKEGSLVSFEDWFSQQRSHYLGHNVFTRHLIEYFCNIKMGDKVLEKDFLQAKKILESFFFVGLTETFDDDAYFIYYLLGIPGGHKRKNVSKKYYNPADKSKVRDLVLEHSYWDIKLYEHAIKLNSKFKKDNSEYHKALKLIKREPSKMDYLKKYIRVK